MIFPRKKARGRPAGHMNLSAHLHHTTADVWLKRWRLVVAGFVEMHYYYYYYVHAPW